MTADIGPVRKSTVQRVQHLFCSSDTDPTKGRRQRLSTVPAEQAWGHASKHLLRSVHPQPQHWEGQDGWISGASLNWWVPGPVIDFIWKKECNWGTYSLLTSGLHAQVHTHVHTFTQTGYIHHTDMYVHVHKSFRQQWRMDLEICARQSFLVLLQSCSFGRCFSC